MSRSSASLRPARALLALCLMGGATHAAETAVTAWPGIGRTATPAEIRAWDIDVRPDFKGLPPGSGTVARGQDIWEARCASCHGVFGESNEVFTPIVGGTTKKDIETGRVAALAKGSEAQRTTMMKVSTLSTLWDYIRRAMPWNNPRTLSVDDTYAVTAYILNLAEVLPADFTLSDGNIRDVQAMLPNRNGKTERHGLWLPSGKPDVKNTACMRDCATNVQVSSLLPDHARGSHGNIEEQTRNLGGMRGQATAAASKPAAPSSEFAAVKDITAKAACMGCHGRDRRIVGPGFNEVLARYKTRNEAESYLAGRIKGGSQGNWGSNVMPPAAALSDNEIALLARWILKGAPE